MKQELMQYMEQRFMFAFDAEVTEETDLFKAGILDSFGYISLMSHIEQEYDVRFDEDELLGDIMVSLSGIVQLVDAARAATAESR